jgi:hypothetical protein
MLQEVCVRVGVRDLLSLRCTSRSLGGAALAALKRWTKRPIAVGGLSEGVVMPELLVLDWETQRWDAALLPPLPDGRGAFACTSLSETEVIVNGGEDQKGLLSSSLVLSTETKAWREIGALSTARSYSSSALCGDGSVVVMGGRGREGTTPDVDRLLPGANDFVAAAPMGTARWRFASCTLKDGRVFVAGGADGVWRPLSSAEIYDPKSDKWTEVAPMPTRRYGCVAVSLTDERGREIVVVFGGWNSSAVEAFDVAAGTWEALPEMDTERSSPCAWRIGDSSVLIGGGWDDGRKVLNSVSLFDLSSRTWRPVPQLTLPRSIYEAGSVQALVLA